MMKKTAENKAENEILEEKSAPKRTCRKKKSNDEATQADSGCASESKIASVAANTISDAVVIDNSGHSSTSIAETDITIEKKLESLYKLQVIDSKIDEIRIVRGELPLEVQDLEDEIAGLETRIENFKLGIAAAHEVITEQRFKIEEAQALIKKYEDQKMNVRNNREYDSLSKEVEYQGLEIQLSEKKIKEANQSIERLENNIASSTQELADRRDVLQVKKSELEGIILETENEERRLVEKSHECEQFIEERLLNAYERIRKNVRNGLAVVQIERDACAGCFNKIPPQRQLDIKMHKKIIVCEFCGRILVDDEMASRVKQELADNQ